jgi:hypothetical protein
MEKEIINNYNDFQYWKTPPLINILDDDDNDPNLNDIILKEKFIDYLYYENKFNKKIIINDDYEENYFNNLNLLNDNLFLKLDSQTLSYSNIDNVNFKQPDQIISQTTTTPLMNNNNVITSTRFLHLTNSPFNKKNNNVANIVQNLDSCAQNNDDLNCAFIADDLFVSQQSTTPSTDTTPIATTANSSGGGVVSRIKSWIGIRKNSNSGKLENTTPVAVPTQVTTSPRPVLNQNEMMVDLASTSSSTSVATSSSSSFKLTKLFLQQTSVDSTNDVSASATTSSTNFSLKTPSELLYLMNNNVESYNYTNSVINNIDKKLKRPTNVPSNIEYNTAQVFQGNILFLYSC